MTDRELLFLLYGAIKLVEGNENLDAVHNLLNDHLFGEEKPTISQTEIPDPSLSSRGAGEKAVWHSSWPGQHNQATTSYTP